MLQNARVTAPIVSELLRENQQGGRWEGKITPLSPTHIRVKNRSKYYFQKDFFKLINNSVFGKTMKNVRKYRDIKSVTTVKRRNQLVSEPNYYTTRWFSEGLLAIEIKKIKLISPVYFGLSILEISKTLSMNFGMIILNRSIKTMQNCVIWILTGLFIRWKLKIFMKILLIMLKNGSTHQATAKMIKDRFQKVLTRK